MSLLAGLERVAMVGVRENPAWPTIYSDLSFLGAEHGLKPQADLKRFLQSYKTFPTVAACMNKLIALCSVVPWYQADRDSGKRLDEPRLKNWMGEDLIKRPNPGEGETFFRMKCFQQLGYTGNNYIAVGNTMLDPRELWCLESDAMRARPSRDNQYPFESFIYHGARRRERIDAESVVFTRRPHPNDKVYGLSYLEESADALEILWLSRQYNKWLLKRGGRTGGILVLKGHVGEEEFRRVKQQVEERQNPKNAGKVVIVGSEDGSFSPDQTMPRDMEHKDTILEAKLEIYNVFGFMPALFATRDVNRSNLREAKASAYEDVVRPLMTLLLEQINNSAMCQAAGVQILADWNAVEALQPNLMEKAQAMALLLDRQVAVPNEVALLFGLSEKPWGDEPSRPTNAWATLGLAPPGATIDTKQLELKGTPVAQAGDDDMDPEQRSWINLMAPSEEALVARILSSAARSYHYDGARVSSVIVARAVEKLQEQIDDLRESRGGGAVPDVPALADVTAAHRTSPATEERIANEIARLDSSDCSAAWVGTRAFGDLERGSARDQAWCRAERRRQERENAWVEGMRPLWDDLEVEVIRAVRSAADGLPAPPKGARGMDSKVPESWVERTWFDIVEAAEKWGVALSQFGLEDVRAGMEHRKGELERLLAEVALDFDDPRIREFVNAVLGAQVQGITETTRARLAAIVEATVREDESVAELAIRLQEEFTFARRARSRVIARTETARLFTEGGILAMEQNGVQRHSWLATRDSRTRPAHREADGQVVAVGESFVLTDPTTGRTSSGRGPGQMDAAWASANCRCTTVPEIEEA